MNTPRARLFSALLPADEVTASLRDELASHREPVGSRELRWATEDQWHVTLGFYGDDDPVARAGWLRERLAGLRAPVVRLSGSGTFPTVLWVHVAGDGLTDVAEAVRTEREQRAFRAHLTLARGGRPGALTAWRRLLAAYASPEWVAEEVVLMRSDAGEHGPVYSVVERFGLVSREC